jgi:hypothetical protein
MILSAARITLGVALGAIPTVAAAIGIAAAI